MFLIIIFIGLSLLAVILEKKHTAPKIDPVLLKRFFWSEMKDYQNSQKGKIIKEKIRAKNEAKRLVLKKAKIDGTGLPVLLGKDINDREHTLDLARLPHLLIAGASGEGKSNFLNGLVTNLGRLGASIVHLKLVDVKIVEFARYKSLSNAEVYNDVDSCITMLKKQQGEIKKRLELLTLNNVKNVLQFNAKFSNRIPFIVIVIDEFASLALASKEFNELVSHISRIGRAAGIHLVLATQRPDKDAITPQIKANMGGIIAFRVATSSNSRVILDMTGAENLKQKGRCLFKKGAHLIEIQTPLFNE